MAKYRTWTVRLTSKLRTVDMLTYNEDTSVVQSSHSFHSFIHSFIHSFFLFRTSCDPKRPVKNVVLLKTHRAGGGTLANIIYRYGDLNDLEFALPKHGSYDFYWPLHFNPSFVDKQYLNSSSPNLLINARYSPDTMTSFMPKVNDYT